MAIGKSTKEIIWHLLNVCGKIAEELKFHNYYKKENNKKIENEETSKKSKMKKWKI